MLSSPKRNSTWNFTCGPFSLCAFYEISSGQTCHPQIIVLAVVHIFMSSFKMYSLTLHNFAILSSSRQEQGLLRPGVQSHSGGWSWNLPQVRNSGVFNLNWDLDSLEVAQRFIHIEIHTYFISWWWFPSRGDWSRLGVGRVARELCQQRKRRGHLDSELLLARGFPSSFPPLNP